MQPEFSVVVPTYHQPALLLKCLDALGRQRLPRAQFEVIVVDDGNSPETATAVQLFAKQIAREGIPLAVRYLCQSERRGPTAARNRGWQAARGRIIAFTNDDCQPSTEWLSSVLTYFQRGAEVVSGQLRVLLPSQPSSLDHTATVLKQADFMAANCFCRKSTLECIGGFDEAFNPAWQEDNDLRFQFIQAEIPVEKCPEAVVVYPIRPTPWYGLLHDERNNSYDALLYKRYLNLFHERIPPCWRQIVQYYLAVLSILIGIIGLCVGQGVIALTGFGIWTILSVHLLIRYLPTRSLTWTTIKYTVLIALTTPFLSVYWRLYGAFKF